MKQVKNILRSRIFYIQTISISLMALCLVVGLSYAWTTPTSAPPAGNASAPLNTSGYPQAKEGGLIINTGGASTGLIVQKGNVGIGTTRPSSKLDVAGTAQLRGSSGGTGLYVDSNGNVGIGTTRPWSSKLYIEMGQTGTASLGRVASNYAITVPAVQRKNYQGIIGVGEYPSHLTVAIATFDDGKRGAQGLLFATGDNNIGLSEAMRIKSNGNVGIGTTRPMAKLEVAGDIRADKIYDRNNTSYYLDPASTSKFKTINLGGVSKSAWPSGGSSLWSQSGSNVYRNSGNIGIGTKWPRARLEVNGNIELSGASPTYKITNVAAPTADSDVATKSYVDAAMGGSNFSALSGSNFSICLVIESQKNMDCPVGWTTILSTKGTGCGITYSIWPKYYFNYLHNNGWKLFWIAAGTELTFDTLEKKIMTSIDKQIVEEIGFYGKKFDAVCKDYPNEMPWHKAVDTPSTVAICCR